MVTLADVNRRRSSGARPTPRTYTAVRGLAAKALANGGARSSPTAFSWNVAGNCESPVHREWSAKPYQRDTFSEIACPKHSIAGTIPTMTVELEVPCRNCQRCLARRASAWRMRAIAETRVWPRTWFGTLTLRPEVAFRTRLAAEVNSAKRAVPLEAESDDRKFAAHVKAIGPEVGKFLKRVRKNTGARIRYLLVAEAHKSGVPHFHMLVHQCDLGVPVRYDDLKSQWDLGFSSWKLTDERTASYVCKYLAKSLRARVRASQAYGECPNAFSLVDFNIDVKNMTPLFNEHEGPVLERNDDEFPVSGGV